ncbi:MAG: glyoxalase [Nannocystaceae bacterium]
MPTPPFHLAFAVDDLSTTRTFYGELLACPIGREDPRWIDFDFWGHQITAHLAPRAAESTPTNQVDGEAVPASHFGAILPWDEWEALAERLRGAGVPLPHRPADPLPGRTRRAGDLLHQGPERQRPRVQVVPRVEDDLRP